MPYTQRPTRGRYGRKWHDEKAPDGFTVNGWRKITKGGYITICGSKHYHEEFSEWVGMWVFCEIDDCYAINAVAWRDEPWDNSKPGNRLLLCNAKDWNEREPDAPRGGHWGKRHAG